MNALQRQAKTSTTPLPTLISSGVLQRQCACGNHTIAGEECDECRKEKLTLQRFSASRSGEEEQAGEVPSIVVYPYMEAQGESGQILPKLSLYQNGSGFKGLADQQAKRIKAISQDSIQNCKLPPTIGSIPYDTGADIINSIAAPNRCYGWKLNELHFFGHSGNHGVFDSTDDPEIHQGLYADWFYEKTEKVSELDKKGGARCVSDIPTGALADNVVFVFHGCNTALTIPPPEYTPSFAEILFTKLTTPPKKKPTESEKELAKSEKKLTELKVFGHYYKVAPGQLQDWIEFSKEFKNKKRETIEYHKKPFLKS